MTETTKRVALIARVAILQNLGGPWDDPLALWAKGEAWVAAREAAPDEPVKCPCCEELVTLCVEHHELRKPGEPCVICRGVRA